MAGKVKDYVSSVSPDYNAFLSTYPQRVLVETGSFRQEIVEYDDENVQVITFADTPKFFFRLQWDAITEAEADAIYDLYFDVNKAKGQARSFKWTHPQDLDIYVVKFVGAMDKVVPDPFRRGINEILLRVMGYTT